MSGLRGRFTFVRRIGAGGFAEVALARAADGSLCVVKRMLPHLSDKPDIVRMFLDEGRVASLLRHANIPALLERGHDLDVGSYMILEYVDGVTLGALQRHLAATGQVMPVDVAARLVSDACRGLHHAHRAVDEQGRPLQLVHRDISPQNIMVSRTGQVKVLDFGIAKTAVQTEQTGTGVLKGKLGYMAPEYCEGLEPDPRADVWAMGVTLHELLTGIPLFPETNPALAIRRITQDTPAPPSAANPAVPAALDRVVMAALQRRPSSRTADARTLAEQLDALGRQLGWMATPAEVSRWLASCAAAILPPDVAAPAPVQPVATPFDLPAPARAALTLAERVPRRAPPEPRSSPVVMGTLVGSPVMSEGFDVVDEIPAPSSHARHLRCPQLRQAVGFRSDLNQMFADIVSRHRSNAAGVPAGTEPPPPWRAREDDDPFRPRSARRDVRSLNRSFYLRLFARDMLGGRIQGGGQRYVSWGRDAAGMEKAGVEVASGRYLPFLEVSSMEHVISAVGELGGRVVQPPVPAPGGAFAIIQDPAGTALGLMQAA